MRRMKRDVWNDDSLNVPRTPSNVPILPIIVPYNELGTKLATRWRNIINQDATFSGYKLITAYTVGHSLRRKLVSSLSGSKTTNQTTTNTDPISTPPQSTSAATSDPDGCFRCLGTHCKSCTYVNASTHIVSTSNGNSFSVRGHINCRSTNVIYVITCLHCNLQYVGETSRCLADRLRDHLSCIKLNKNSAIGIHFNTTGHSANHLSITGIERSKRTAHTDYRRIREATWTTLLQTAHPLGLNFTPSTRC
jgi:hypothetical protein